MAVLRITAHVASLEEAAAIGRDAAERFYGPDVRCKTNVTATGDTERLAADDTPVAHVIPNTFEATIEVVNVRPVARVPFP